MTFSIFATESDLYSYADDNCVSVSHAEINILSSFSQSETQSMVKWFTDNSMKANAVKFQGNILCGGREKKTININVGESDICFVSKIEVLGVCIDDKLNFNDHVKRMGCITIKVLNWGQNSFRLNYITEHQIWYEIVISGLGDIDAKFKNTTLSAYRDIHI